MDVKERRVVPLHVLNVSNEVYHLAAETVVALAKPVIECHLTSWSFMKRITRVLPV